MKDFASTALFNLIAGELQRQGFNAKTNPKFEGKTERTSKASLLDSALDSLGPAAILRIGQGIHRVDFDPTLTVLTKSVDATDLVERWQRLEGYFHGNHRVRLLVHSANGTKLEHYALSGPGPSEGEDLVIAGLLAALLQNIGARSLNLAINEREVLAADTIIDSTPRSSNTRIWSYSWTQFTTQPRTQSSMTGDQSPADKVSALLASDLGRSWKVATAAEVLNTSTRSLQRSLAKAGASFQTLLRVARAEGAASMLINNEHRLAEIGYAAGYSDQAHFSREFKLRFNMPPKEYVTLSE